MTRRLRGKILTLLLALVLSAAMNAAMAETLDDFRAKAQSLVGEQATLIESERDDGLYEFEFRDDSARYDIHIRANDGAVIEFETSYANVPRAKDFILTEAEARAKAMARFPDAAVSLAIAERDDGGAVYEVFLTTAGAPATLTINAETGDLLREELYPAAAGVLSADKLSEFVPGPYDDLELNYDDGRYIYDGNVGRDEFEADAFTGKVLEWDD